MNAATTRFVFALLCLAGIIAICTGAFLEISRMRRRDTSISVRHFRMRMLSAVLWILILSALAYGTLFEWPKDKNDAVHYYRFGAIMEGSMRLMMVAIVVFGLDVLATVREQMQQRRRYISQVSEVARLELERIRATAAGGVAEDAQGPLPPSDAPSVRPVGASQSTQTGHVNGHVNGHANGNGSTPGRRP